MKVVTIFARGESAKFIDSLEKPKFTVIANEFGNELEAFPQIGEYVKDSEVHICCNGWPTELDSYKRINFFDNYNVTKLVEQVKSIPGVTYVLFGLSEGANGSRYIAPHSILSELNPRCCPVRDLFGELAEAFQKEGYKVLAYMATEG